ncbi:class I SAM-dependent methyltransferase [Legionella yabuuchiae]|uniref:class I SAM-dependent methyltransferase n=1 Tax=Legionella yabuuchiae TaxID=376727 RepID=UPI0010562201|nr:class I SAM-dependent methyltransferase [Legionella yabuuchiae]
MDIQKADSYLGLATQFYDFIRPEPPEDAYLFYRSYVSEADGYILEPMCGSGRFLIPLVEEGFNVHGFDASDHMLKALQDKATSKHLKPRVWQDFAENLERNDKYSLIFIPSGSFGHIIDFTEIKKTLENFYNCLNEKGILLFEVESSLSALNSQLGIWRGMVCNMPNGDSILLSRLSNIQNSVCYSIDKYELLNNNQIIQTQIEKFNVRLYDDRTILSKLLQDIGFQEIKILKTYERRSNPDENDAAFVYECRK